jgi:DNA-binding response OmpR family regulator
MSVAVPSLSWVLPGCGTSCRPRQHDPSDHEAFGRLLERAEIAPKIVRTGGLVVDLHAETVTVAGEVVALTWREWGILAHLAQHLGQICPADDILSAVWQMASVGSQRRADLALLTTNVHRLRKKLGTAGHLIETLPSGRSARRLRKAPPL